MKNNIFIFLVSFGFITNSFAQENAQNNQKKKDNYFYVGPLDLFLNTLQMGYERKLKNHNTIALIGGFKLSKKDEIINRLGGTGEFQYRVNLLYNKEALSSVVKKYSTFAYFAPYLQYRYEEITDRVPTDISISEKEITIVNSGFAGLGFGFRLTALENRFCLNVYAGGGLKYSDVSGNKKYADFTEVGYTGIAPKLSFQIGIAF
ncbi:MAG: hypothetical protein WCH21_10430 [Bacteroidota bacterium]